MEVGAAEGDSLRRVTRLLRIMGYVGSPARYGLQGLADACGCSTKTIQRDLNELKNMGVPVQYDAEVSAYRLYGPLPFALLDLGLAEATALALAEATSLSARGMSVDDNLTSAFEKVRSLLPPAMAARLEESRRALVGAGGAKKDYSKAPLLPLVSACREHRAVRMDYASTSSTRRWREVHPYCVAYLDGFWMLVAYDPSHKEVRTFALDRIHALSWLEPPTKFTVPGGWSLMEYMAGSVGVLRGKPTDIRLRFDARVAPSVMGRKWRFSHQLDSAGAGGDITLSGTVAGLDEITHEVLRWGRLVTVEAPEDLCRRVAEEARAIAAK
jgi:predicted DNA-binding transcriptional regulator YafY